MKTYLVTGGAGFIGSNFINYMLKKYDKDIKIINLDLLTYAGNLENLKNLNKNNNYKFIKGNICDKFTVEKIFQNNDIDYVIHFAAESHVDRSIVNPIIFVETNIMGTQILLNVAKENWQIENGFKNDKKYIQISTDEVYGSLGTEGYFTEETNISPHSPYSASKASADMIVMAYYNTYKMPINITRCSNNYGPYQFPEKLIPLMINNALIGEKMPVYGKGENIRDWLYVEDHIEAIDIVLRKGELGEVYNIGGNNEKQNIEIVNIIIDIINELLLDTDLRKNKISTNLIKYVEDRKGHDFRYAIDATKIKNKLGWTPKVMFDEGIKKTIKWYLENESWTNNIINGNYIKYNKKNIN